MLGLKIKLAAALVTSVIISLFVLTPNIYAAVLFQDNFDTGNNDKWTIIGNSGWNVQNGQYGIHLDPGLSNTLPIDSLWNFSWTSIAYDVDVKSNNGVDKNILLKFKDTSNFIEIHGNDHGIFLDKASSQGGGGNIDFTPIILNKDTTYHFRSEINNDKIKVYLNNNLIFDDIESTPIITNWKIGLRAGTGAVSPTDVWFDNVVVTDLPAVTISPTPSPTSSPSPIPTPTPSPTFPSISVPDIKQYSPPWGNKTYDQAKSWFPSDPTITRWGCALTSADMILQKYGFTINPGDLNTWLISQNDGYIPNGQLNWLAISRYSKQNSTSTIPALEYKRLSPSDQNLINELIAGRPAILQEPGHFIVAKSKTQTSFGINDPAYANHPTLSSYNNSFENIMTYTPSHTDLSYIMLTIDPAFSLKVFNRYNQEITGQTFIDEPLTDDMTNDTNSGNSIKTFEFPKPPNGSYKVEINGSGIYELSSYLYDLDGNVNLTKFNGIVNNNTDEFQINIGSNDIITQNLTIDKIIEDWDNAKLQNKIKSKTLYDETKLTLRADQGLIKNYNSKLAKTILGVINILLKNYTPQLVDKTVSQIIQSEIQTLINSL